jgi:molybdate transport system substrate-binding protein
VSIRPLAFLCSPVLLLAACGSASTTTTSAGLKPVTLFAAASLERVLGDEIVAFGQTPAGSHLPQVAGDYEGTQSLLAKLEADPTVADVFASADKKHMDTATRRGLVETSHVLAYNTLVIAVAPGNPKHINGLADLARPGLRISLADTSVPAGSYAEKAFQAAEADHDAPAGFAKAALANVVTRQTEVETVLSDVAFGAADAGIVYATDARANHQVSAVPVAPADQPQIAYYVSVVKRGQDHAAAQSFVDFLLSQQGQQILAAAGFATSPPPSP